MLCAHDMNSLLQWFITDNKLRKSWSVSFNIFRSSETINLSSFKMQCINFKLPLQHKDWQVYLPYFFAYKMVFFPFQNNPKNLDPSYKMDLDFLYCLGRVKSILQQNCIGLIYLYSF